MGKVLWSLLVLACFSIAPANGQEENHSQERAKTEQPKAFHAYRVDFVISELEDGKKINSRHYSMDLNSGDHQQLKIGTRVPVATGSASGPEASALVNTQFQYMDVGTNIICRLDEHGDDVDLDVHGDFSNFSAPDTQHASANVVHQPIIRSMIINGSTLASLSKAVVIGVVDDPNSNREFQLEATVTKLK
jgi:hypothetical protein